MLQELAILARQATPSNATAEVFPPRTSPGRGASGTGAKRGAIGRLNPREAIVA
jgi:hypothetical protein